MISTVWHENNEKSGSGWIQVKVKVKLSLFMSGRQSAGVLLIFNCGARQRQGAQQAVSAC